MERLVGTSDSNFRAYNLIIHSDRVFRIPGTTAERHKKALYFIKMRERKKRRWRTKMYIIYATIYVAMCRTSCTVNPKSVRSEQSLAIILSMEHGIATEAQTHTLQWWGEKNNMVSTLRDMS